MTTTSLVSENGEIRINAFLIFVLMTENVLFDFGIVAFLFPVTTINIIELLFLNRKHFFRKLCKLMLQWVGSGFAKLANMLISCHPG